MQLIWGFVNSLQLIANLPLYNINIPSNLFYLFSLIAGPLAFNLFDPSEFTWATFKLNPNDDNPYNNQFNNFGVSDSFVMLGMSTSFYYFLLSPSVLLIIFLLKFSARKNK